MKHILMLLLVLAGLSLYSADGPDCLSNNDDYHKFLLRFSAYWSQQGCADLAEKYAGIVAKTDAPKVREEKAKSLSGLDRPKLCLCATSGLPKSKADRPMQTDCGHPSRNVTNVLQSRKHFWRPCEKRKRRLQLSINSACPYSCGLLQAAVDKDDKKTD